MSDQTTFNIGCLALLGILAIGGCIAKQNHREQHTFTVSSKERQCDKSGDSVDCYYVVFGTQGEVFENRDSGILNGKWDSASMQARFIPGRRYQVTTIGWRMPLFSMKPNIITMQEVGIPASGVPLQ
ncbi:hypothetical protein AI27_12675 [Sphingomonas sp. BHC-A]|nr:hypothetical protein AI27_12675 [Sphingomonas sp. BHC-A]